MEETESQIAKIQLGNTKSSSAYVYAMAEKAPVGDAELYVVAELPVFNPAAEESCERICLAIASTLKRSYRKPVTENAFENAISQVNEELGKLASMGQTQWIYKLNCVLAAREGQNFHIASCGKVSAFLLRGGEFTDISCSQNQSHPLKTFENYASGKIRLGDLLLLSTTQLFNYLSMDRVLNILESADFLTATQTIIQLLKENADPQISFAVLLNLQVPLGQSEMEDVDLENYAVEAPAGENFFGRALSYIQTAFAMGKDSTRRPKIDLPKVSLSDKIKNISGNAKNLAGKSKSFWQSAKFRAKAVKGAVNKEKFQNLSPAKKFFFVSALVLLVALVANIVIAAHLKKTRGQQAQISGQLDNAQNLLNSAQASLLYKDYPTASNYMAQAKAALPAAKLVPASDKNEYNRLLAQYSSQEQEMEHVVQATVQNLGNLGQGDRLIRLPNYVAVQAGNAVISYNIQNGQVQDSQLSAGVSIVDSSYISGNNAAVYDGSNLYVWDFSASTLSPGFSQSVPQKSDFGGMAYYSTNSRVYVLDKKNSQIVNFAAAKSGLSRPVVSVSDPSLSGALDMAIDGNIYVLTSGGIEKFLAGHLTSFNTPQLETAFSGSGKIYTEKDFNNLYLLDSGNNRILVMDKSGNLMYTLESDQFTKPTDFQVDEKNNVIYVLNDGSLLKVTLP